MPVFMDVLDGPAKGQRIEIKVGESVTFGRSEAAMVTIGDPEMAPVHFHIGMVKGKLALHTVPDDAMIMVNGSPVHSAILGDGDRVLAGTTVMMLVAPPPIDYQAKVRIGGWGFASVPAGWHEFGGMGFELNTGERFMPTITAFEEPLPPGLKVLEYVGAQTNLITTQFRHVRIEGPTPTQIVGAEQALELDVTSSVPDGRTVIQRQLYVLAAGMVGVLTATALERQMLSLQVTIERVFRSAVFYAHS